MSSSARLLSKVLGHYILSMKTRISAGLTVFVYPELLYGGALHQSGLCSLIRLSWSSRLHH